MRTAERATVFISVVLVAAVVTEVLLFRIFARGGVYFIHEDSPLVVRNGYTSLVFAGNVLFNYAAPVTLLLVVLAAYSFVTYSLSPVRAVIGAAVIAVASVSGLMVLGYSGEALSNTYWAVSSIAVIGIAVFAVREIESWPMRLFTVAAGASYLAVYAFKSGQGLPGMDGVAIFSAGEWLGLIGFLVLAFALRPIADRRALIAATVFALVAGGMVFGRGDSVPLIATWAFGLSLSAPYWLYIGVLWIVIAFSGSAFARGQYLTAIGVLLIFFGHRSIPLTYFNDLAICGLLLIVSETVAGPVSVRSGWLHRHRASADGLPLQPVSQA